MTDNEILNRRVLLGLIGGAAGVCFWLLFDVLSRDVLLERVVLGASALAISFFGPLLGLIGPLSPKRALIASLIVSIPSSLLFFWASFRFEDVDGYISSLLPIAAFALLVTLPLPFLISWGKDNGLRHYPTLFMEAWGIAVRYAAAWVFVLLFWLVLLLSDQLLQLVGFELIDLLLEIDWVMYALIGGVLGVAIAVVDELSDYVSPNLILRLLRLLLPLLLVIVVIFVAAIPLRGLSGLFGNFSAATLLTAIVIAAATLITTALDTSDADAVRSPLMRASAQILAVLMPILSGLATYAIWLRVDQYGWTPARLAAVAVALIFLGYSVLYAIAVLRRKAWMQSIRQANVIKAVVIIVVAALWLTPVLNTNRISANSQVARLMQGKVSPQEFDVWALTHEWGRDGARVAEKLEAGKFGDVEPAVLTRIRTAQAEDREYKFREIEREGNKVTMLESLKGGVKIMPLGKFVNDEQLARLSDYEIRLLKQGCDRKTPNGNPGCVAVEGMFRPLFGQTETMVFYLQADGFVRSNTLDSKSKRANAATAAGPAIRTLRGAFIDALFSGDFKIEPLPMNMLSVNESKIYINP